MKPLTNEILAPYTYIKIGGAAERLFIATTTDELIEAVRLAQTQHTPYTILGAASNVLISDEGLSGTVIINRTQAITVQKNHPNHVLVESGTIVNSLVNFTNVNGLAGLSDFLGLPGTVGGAVYNNSHHLSHLIGSYISQVTVMTEKGSLRTVAQSECGFDYDTSVFQHTHEVIVSVEFALTPGDPDALASRAREALKHRRDTQPLELPSSGCMFKNPSNISFSAGYLIDTAGCKSWRVGDAQVSEKHANFMVNLGHATAADLVSLSNQVRRQVQKIHGISLTREIFFLGNHPGLET